MHRLQLAKTSQAGSANRYLRIKPYKKTDFQEQNLPIPYNFRTTYTNIYIFLQQ